MLEKYEATKDGRFYALLGFFYANVLKLKIFNDYFKDIGLCLSLLEYLLKEPNALKDHIFTTYYKMTLPNLDRKGEKTNFLRESESMQSDYIFREKA
mmetsp:Transcript_16311/g.13978  ORF Transcript_16311/g.13978 Transcript_16311/m.13978 type:complete len:97 (-) Transcript_16311:1655-1945(-)